MTTGTHNSSASSKTKGRDRLRILIVDDSPTFRRLMSEVVKMLPGAELVDTAPDGYVALQKLKSEPIDLIFLDVEMPRLGGLETLQLASKLYPDIGVIMISALGRSSADVTVRALEMGAFDFIPKPEVESPGEAVAELRHHIASVLPLFAARRNIRLARKALEPLRHRRSRTSMWRPASASEEEDRAGRRAGVTAAPVPEVFKVVVVGVSTGGPKALASFLPELPGDLGVPVLLVQHMPPVFTASLADRLNQKCSLAVKEAEDGETVKPNTIYVAPGEHHMTVAQQSTSRARTRSRRSASAPVSIHLNSDLPVNNCRPSVDVLFDSVAETYGGDILGVVMTGMGRDGREGMRAMKGKGCYCITQSPSSCVVYGMPRAVVEGNLSDESADLAELAPRVASLVKRQ